MTRAKDEPIPLEETLYRAVDPVFVDGDRVLDGAVDVPSAVATPRTALDLAAEADGRDNVGHRAAWLWAERACRELSWTSPTAPRRSPKRHRGL